MTGFFGWLLGDTRDVVGGCYIGDRVPLSRRPVTAASDISERIQRSPPGREHLRARPVPAAGPAHPPAAGQMPAGMAGEQDDLPPHAELPLNGNYEASPELRRERFVLRFVHTCLRRRVTP